MPPEQYTVDDDDDDDVVIMDDAPAAIPPSAAPSRPRGARGTPFGSSPRRGASRGIGRGGSRQPSPGEAAVSNGQPPGNPGNNNGAAQQRSVKLDGDLAFREPNLFVK